MMVYRRARVAAPNSRGENDVVDWDAAGEGGWRGQRGVEGARERTDGSGVGRVCGKSVASEGAAAAFSPRQLRRADPRNGLGASTRAVVSGCRVESRAGKPRAMAILARASRHGGRGGARTGARDGPRADINLTDDRAENPSESVGSRRDQSPWSIARGRRASNRSLDPAGRIGWDGREDAQDELDEEDEPRR